MFFAFLGILSGIIGVIADIPYIIDTYRRKTQPHRITWFLFFILNAISFANNATSGATNSLWLIAGWTLTTFVVFILSIKKGVGGYNKLDIAVLVGSIIGLLLWWILGTPLASIIANTIVATLAFIPTFKKAYVDPASETKITWSLCTLSSFIGILSVGKLDYVLLVYPVYSFLVQGGLYTVIEIRTRQLKA